MKRRLAAVTAIGLVALAGRGAGATTDPPPVTDPIDVEGGTEAWQEFVLDEHGAVFLPACASTDNEMLVCYASIDERNPAIVAAFGRPADDGSWFFVEFAGEDLGEPVEYEGDGIVTEGDGSIEEIEERAVEAIRPYWPADTPQLELRRKAQPYVEMCTSDLSDNTNAVSLSVALSSSPEAREILEAACPARIAEFDART